MRTGVAALIIVCIVAFATEVALGQDFRLLAWNVESNRPSSPPVSDPVVLGKELTELLTATATRSQIIALSEVDPKSFQVFAKAAAAGLKSEIDFVTSASGGFQDSDSLMLVVDTSRFLIEEAMELHRFAGVSANFNVTEESSPEFGTLRARSPLAVKVRDKSDQKTFWVIVNHLARGEAELRTDQARMLVKWAAAHPEPIISAGDHNLDFEFKTQKGNAAFDAMLEGGVWEWVKPDPLIDSNWSSDFRIQDRNVDRYPDSILDFIFVANQAKGWHGKSAVVVRDEDFPDNEKTSDHRPLIADFNPVK